MGLHKLTAGDGYTYLLRNVAAQDATHRGRPSLNDYYSDKGEAPGQWWGRGLQSLAAPEGLYANLDAVRAKDIDGQPVDLWTVEAGSYVSEKQMKALFGLGLHPNAQAASAAMEAVGAARAAADEAARLGRPFRVNPAETEMNRRLAVAYRDHNISIGQRWDADVDDEIAAQIKTSIGGEMFADEYGRAPADDRELSGFIARNTRQLTTSVAGYDLTFTPVKSLSVLWALAPRDVAAVLERCHDRAVTDALEWLQSNACFTRTGTDGVAQVDTDGLIAARFTHRDSRAGDPNLHTHVAVSAKVRHTKTVHGVVVSQWLALDGRPLYQANVSASELYNSRLERHVSGALGIAFAERGDRAEKKRTVREVVGIPQELIDEFSSRRAMIDTRRAELSKQFQVDHGREPDAVEQIKLAQQATLETREAKHEPRSLAEQRQQWRSQATQLLGSQQAVQSVIDNVFRPHDHSAGAVTAKWIDARAIAVINTVMESRSTWQRHHVFAEAQRVVRGIGPAASADLADKITARALAEHSIAQHSDRGAEMGEPAQLRRRDGASVYRLHGIQPFTSRAILAAEKRILHATALDGGHTVPADDVEFALLAQAKSGRTLNAGQSALVEAMAQSGRRVMLGLAPAGSGKTTAMTALTRAWECSGGTVIGLSPSASAAQLLRDEIDIPVADTVDKFNWLATNPTGTPGGDAAREWFDTINESTLIIVDEAGKTGTLALDNLIAAAVSRGASVRLIGDDRQLGSVAAGGVLRDIAETSGALTLSQIMRFASAAEAQALSALRIGDPAGLGFYADNHRIHVGTDTTATDMAFAAWCADLDAGRDSIINAPTNDLVDTLNAKARQRRLETLSHTHPSPSGEELCEVDLAGGHRASVGDVIMTKKNDRRLRLSATDFVRNGYRWTVTAVHRDGSVTAVHTASELVMTLPADYVATNVRLGYASTIDASQGATARYRCHTVGGDNLTRQQVYTALSRGVHENHIYLSTAEDDPHRILHPKATHPETAIDVLTRALARDDAQVSATTAARRAADPMLTLGDNVARYTDALGAAAETMLTGEESAAIDANANRIHPGLTDCAAWPVLRKNLALMGANNRNPLRRLAAAATRGGLDGAADPAAVLDWRLDPTGAHSGGTGPLPWLAAQPARVRNDPEWSTYLDRRATLITDQVTQIRHTATTWTTATAPTWARPLITTDPELVADLAVFRAAHKVPDLDTRIAGPELYADRSRAVQTALEQRVAAAIGHPDTETARWNQVVDAIDPRIRTDSYWPQLATHLTAAARTGADVRELITTAAEAGPLPDELPAAALWWRITDNATPAMIAATGLDAATYREAARLIYDRQRRRARERDRHRDTGYGLDL